MSVKTITNLQEFKDAISSDSLTVVDFYATWCGPCKVIAPKMDQLAEKHTSVNFYKIDVDAVPDVAQENAISAMPTILFFKGGNKVDTVVGANLQKIVSLVESNA